MTLSGRVSHVMTGRVAPLLVERGEGDRVRVPSGIRKSVVSALASPVPVAVGRLGLAGDEQADPEVHGGLEKAVYVYPSAHYAAWQAWLGRAEPLPPGSFGENLLIDGLIETDLWIGDELQIGNCRLRLSLPRRPCYKLNVVLGNARAGREMLLSGRTGWYMAVEQGGQIAAGDAVTVIPGSRQLTLAERIRQMVRPADLR